MSQEITQTVMDMIHQMQINEITEYYIYNNIANFVKDEKDKSVLRQIASEEYAHSKIWESYTNKVADPDRRKVARFTFFAKFLGYTFAIKLMESGEEGAQVNYEEIAKEVPEALEIKKDEEKHEAELIEMLDEERLKYVGSMVLGLSDALVELTGTLAGLTFALQNTKLIALSGLITGISATLSMASSEYLSAKSEGRNDAMKSCTYTGIAYCITVVLMILPYLLLPVHSYALALAIMLFVVISEIALFSYYISVAQGTSFKSRVTEMIGISMGVALLAFALGLLAKKFLGIDI